MADSEVVRNITIRARAVGVDESTNSIKQLATSQGNLAIASDKSSQASLGYEAALARQNQRLSENAKMLQLSYQSAKDMATANDNMNNGLKAANDNAAQSGKSLLSAAGDFVTTTSHLKVLALAAYALSPAFRSFANAGVASTIIAIGPAAASAAGTMLSVLSPAFAFLTRMTIPIALIVATWQLLNAVIKTGSDLLEKYGNAQRNLVSGVDDNLAKLTKFQDGDLSAQQVQYATELGSRLSEAKKTISDFARVQLDLTAPALMLQAVWVTIVETIAKAVDGINSIIGYIGRIPGLVTGLVGAIPVVGPLYNAGKAAGSLFGDGGASNTPVDPMVAARQRLAAGMGSQTNFANRFGQGVNDLADVKNKKPDDPTAEAKDSWDRAIESIDKHAAALTADTLSVGQSVAVHDQLRAEFQLLEAAKAADKGVTDEQIKAYTQYRASMDSAQARVAAGIKLNQDDAAEFDRVTASIKAAAAANAAAQVNDHITFGNRSSLLTSEDVAIANQLKTIYGNDIPAAMESSYAASLRLNQGMSQTSQQISGGLTTALVDISMGTKTAAQSFTDFANMAIRAIQQMIVQLLIVGPLMRSLQGGLSGGLGSLFGGGGAANTPDPTFGDFVGPRIPSASGNVFSGPGISAYSGSIVSSPTTFKFASGTGLMGEAGPEAIIPLKRGPDGRLGVSTDGAGSGGQSIHNEFHINVASDATSSDPQAAAETARAVRREMEAMVNSTIMKQKRPGGLLAA